MHGNYTLALALLYLWHHLHHVTESLQNLLDCGSYEYTKETHTVKAPNIAHLSLLTSVGYNKKEIKLKKYAQPNKVIIIYYLHIDQNEKIFS